MNDTVITNVRALEPGKGSDRGWGANPGGKDRRTRPGRGTRGHAHLPEQIDGGGRLLTPGLIDIHTHGIKQFAYEAGPEQFVAATRELLSTAQPACCRRSIRIFHGSGSAIWSG